MSSTFRFSDNPILRPEQKFLWERCGAFNPSPAFDGKNYHLVYRALSVPQIYKNASMQVSSIGYAKSRDGVTFEKHVQLIKPEYDWEQYGCEDPRITNISGNYYIFYTALSSYPFTPDGIKLAVCKTKDFQTFEKHPVTPFNSKAMALFPEKINGKYAAVLTAHTDMPPAKICLAFFEKEEDIWSKTYWKTWYATLDRYVIPLLRSASDQVEVGAQPVKTADGWLLVYSYIKNYYHPNRIFTVEAALLDLDNPANIIARTKNPLLTPEAEYERNGNVKNVVFPSGALIRDRKLQIFYGAADTTGCKAEIDLKTLSKNLQRVSPVLFGFQNKHSTAAFERYAGNPILTPVPEFSWETKAVFNPAAIRLEGKTHLLYRAMSGDNTSVIGYAVSDDGYRIDERLNYPVFSPRFDFERKTHEDGNSGCEDPRIVRINTNLYMCYTAFNGSDPPRVALTSISVDDFLNRNWTWTASQLISPPGVDDKDACILPETVQGKYVIFHRIGFSIWIDFVDSLTFLNDQYITGRILITPRKNKWDNGKVGICAPPFLTSKGWLLFYHGVSNPGKIYRVGALILDRSNPAKIKYRTDSPLFEPEESYEKDGQVGNVVFPCGVVVSEQDIYLYYGCADTVIGVARANVTKLLESITKH